MSGSTSTRVLRPGGPADPDASRTAAIMAAYLSADAARNLRRRVWRDALLVAILGLTLGATTHVFAPGGLARGLLIVAGLGFAAAAWEWHASRRFARLLER